MWQPSLSASVPVTIKWLKEIGYQSISLTAKKQKTKAATIALSFGTRKNQMTDGIEMLINMTDSQKAKNKGSNHCSWHCYQKESNKLHPQKWIKSFLHQNPQKTETKNQHTTMTLVMKPASSPRYTQMPTGPDSCRPCWQRTKPITHHSIFWLTPKPPL